MKTSIPGHDIVSVGNRYYPMYTDKKGRLRYYASGRHGDVVWRYTYESAWNYITRRNPVGNAEQRKRKGWTSETYR